MNILLTGVSGFVGSNTAKYLVRQGHFVVGICRRNVKNKIEGVKYVQCDLSKTIEVEDSIDAIMHIAGQVESSETDVYIDNTILSMRNVIQFALKKSIKIFIYTSTFAVYGNVKGRVNEQSERVDLNTYAMSKLIAENLLNDVDIERKIIIRLPRMVGEGLNYTPQWLPRLTYSLIMNEDINYFNPNRPYNNFMHVEDFAIFCDHLLEDNRLVSGDKTVIMGVASDEELTIKEIINILYHATGSKSKLTEKINTKPEAAYLVDISKAKQYGFMPRPARQTLTEFAQVSLKILGNC